MGPERKILFQQTKGSLSKKSHLIRGRRIVKGHRRDGGGMDLTTPINIQDSSKVIPEPKAKESDKYNMGGVRACRQYL